MGYETALHLIDVKIKDESLPKVRKALQTKRGLALAHSNTSLKKRIFQTTDSCHSRAQADTTALTILT